MAYPRDLGDILRDASDARRDDMRRERAASAPPWGKNAAKTPIKGPQKELKTRQTGVKKEVMGYQGRFLRSCVPKGKNKSEYRDAPGYAPNLRADTWVRPYK